jgi:hypothetical protein
MRIFESRDALRVRGEKKSMVKHWRGVSVRSHGVAEGPCCPECRVC